MENEIKEGSVVTLKSGGPNMTVAWVAEEYGTIKANCDWFVQEKGSFANKNATFPLSSLKLSSD
ncbi:DUF2158 domain-containing protein [Azospirillum brasilense]|uniref:DUF2158 domain-containing protein n=1 Tax=Azospirillum brasilense TaxID=192 RepID=UPI000E6A4F94|nr:DUF2158 domain-containing protein [Azospirillum brasilense]NUB33864.1 DUF2158 domain-containing protein [Azospirillum brasilense]RIW07761.1 DUF2158 domain-containing protein [Azospirillum brasilense]